MRTGAQLIAAERKRQRTEENWSSEHDDSHDAGELARAAICYAAAAIPEKVFLRLRSYAGKLMHAFVDPWPWNGEYDNRERPQGVSSEDHELRMLVKAGALIAAEIDRRQRRLNKNKRKETK